MDERTPSQRMGLDPAAGPLSRYAAQAVDGAAEQEAQFVAATGRDLQMRHAARGIADEGNFIDVQGRLVDDPAIAAPLRLAAETGDQAEAVQRWRARAHQRQRRPPAPGRCARAAQPGARGRQEMSEGRYARGLETMAPTVLRGPLKAWRYETEGVKDKTGIVVQDEVDAAALWGQAAGFSPSDVRNAYEGKSAIVGHDRALMARRSALVEQFAMAAMAGDEEGKAEARAAVAKFNEKNPNRRSQPMQLAQSVAARQKRIREAQEGVYLPSKRRDAVEAGRFAVPD